MKYTSMILLLVSILFFFGCASQSKVQNPPQEPQVTAVKEKLIELQNQEETVQLPKLVQEPAPPPPPPPPIPLPPYVISGNPSTPKNNELHHHRVRVNKEIVNWIQQLEESGGDIKQLIFYPDKSFSIEIEKADNSPYIEIADDGMLVINASLPEPPFNFTDIQEGKIISFTPEIDETFIITAYVEGNNIAMKFRKNAAHGDYYELYSVEIDSVNYALKPLKPGEEPPMLYIYALIDERIRDEREYTADFLAVMNASRINKENKVNAHHERAAESNAAVNPPGIDQISRISEKETHSVNNEAAGKSLNLVGNGTLTQDTVFNFIKERTGTPVLSDSEISMLINLYIEEAAYEEINHDIAIAQMLYMTSVLGNPVFVENNNFAGLIPVRGVWDGNFPNMQRGVRAHIQHLRGYAVGHLNREQNVNPRWNQISDFRGEVRTLDELCEKWSANPSYKEKLNKMLSDLHSFPEK